MNQELKDVLRLKSGVPFLVARENCWISSDRVEIPFESINNNHLKIYLHTLENISKNLELEVIAILRNVSEEYDPLFNKIKLAVEKKRREIKTEIDRRGTLPIAKKRI